MNHGNTDLIEAVSDHIEHHIGPIAIVFDEVGSDDLHIDIHHVAPAPDRPFHALVTSGMSEFPMAVPSGMTQWQHAELSILLDPEWDVRHEAFTEESVYWPVRLLKTLARYPFQQNTWLGYGHTVPGMNAPEGFAPDTRLSSALLLPPITLSQEFHRLPLPSGQDIRFWSVVPLYHDELALKKTGGVDALLNAFDRAGIVDIVSSTRPGAKPKKRRFGPF
jgi:hypothetical protein